MSKIKKIVSIIIIEFIFAWWISLQLLFGMATNLDHSSFRINTLVAIEWFLLSFLVSILIYVGYSKKIILIYYSLLTANIFLMLVKCLKSPICLRNLGFHHASYVPVSTPLLSLSFVYVFFLAYINLRFKEQKVVSQKFSNIIYLFCIVTIIILIYVVKSSQSEMEKILHFQGYYEPVRSNKLVAFFSELSF